MMRKLTRFALAATAALLVGQALAATPVFRGTEQGAQLVSTGAPRSVVVAPRVAAAAEGTVIYSNFGSEEALYDSSWGWSLFSGQWVAVPFTPTFNARIKQVRLAIGYLFGNPNVKVSLNADAGGIPGEVIKKFSALEIPPFGECCGTVSTAFGGATVSAGQTYWIVARVPVRFGTEAAWHGNNTGAEGNWAVNHGEGWRATSGTVGAFEVIGR